MMNLSRLCMPENAKTSMYIIINAQTLDKSKTYAYYA